MDERSSRFEHVEDRARNEVSLHPVERLGEGRIPETTEARRQLLGPKTHPAGIRDAMLRSGASGFDQHVGIGIDTDDLDEQVCEQQRHIAGAATHVDETR